MILCIINSKCGLLFNLEYSICPHQSAPCGSRCPFFELGLMTSEPLEIALYLHCAGGPKPFRVKVDGVREGDSILLRCGETHTQPDCVRILTRCFSDYWQRSKYPSHEDIFEYFVAHENKMSEGDKALFALALANGRHGIEQVSLLMQERG